tara:strand:- start:308 stop:505 length:198 start_codon:yes stop_codon:yes gene_type:complete
MAVLTIDLLIEGLFGSLVDRRSVLGHVCGFNKIPKIYEKGADGVARSFAVIDVLWLDIVSYLLSK